jgi:hypothetical protein
LSRLRKNGFIALIFSRKVWRIDFSTGAPPEILGVGDPQAAEIDRPRLGIGFRLEREGERIAVVLADLRGEQQADVGDAAAHRAQNRDRCPAHRTPFDRDHAGRGAEAHDAAEGGGIAQAAAGVRAGADRQHVGGERRRRAARRTAGHSASD